MIPKVKYEVAEGPAIINMVKYNLGISLLPEMLVSLQSDYICIKNWRQMFIEQLASLEFH